MWHDNIDKIFLINLNDKIGQERLPIATNELLRFNIPFKRHEAIKNEKNGATGLLHTMRILFEENQGQSILIFEDDIMFIRHDVNEIMEGAMSQLPEDYLCLYLGCNFLTPPFPVTQNILRIGRAYSSHAVLYSAEGIKTLLSKWNDSKPYDVFLMENLQSYGKCLCVHPMIASQRIGFSSIEKRVTDWDTMMKVRNEMFTKNFT